ncbi:MAG: hypothetical protein JSW51_02180 [Gemmatimonadota bacterium]|nr:MAG: hypothetical protein JSW51_02180 [Gemmatimonadota bacterium]
MKLSKSAFQTLIASLALSTAVSGLALGQVDVSQLSSMKARSIGPNGMSGRIGAIDGVHGNPNIIYVGAATGGLWKSVSGGAKWEPIMDSLKAPSIGAIAIFQAAPDIVWVGTGEKGRRNSSGVGTGVYKSMDGGHTWSHLGLEGTESISEIILDPTNQNVAYIAAQGPTWGDGEERGVFKTTDGGATWRKVLYVNERTGAADLIMDPSNPNKLFAAMWEFRRWPWFFKSGGPGSGLYITHDGGESWRQVTPEDGMLEGELGRMGLAIAPSNPNYVYALVEAKRSAVLRSTDGGRSWEVMNNDRGIANRPFYYCQLAVDPTNENRVYKIESPISLTIDGGKTWEVILPFDERVHIDHHAWYVNPLDGNFIITGNDGGVYISRDRGNTWRFVENLPLAQFYHINVDMDTPYNVYGGLQDNGSWMGPSEVWENGGIRYYHWREVAFGDGFATIVDPVNPRYVYAMSQGGYISRYDKNTGENMSVRPAHPDDIRLRFHWNAGIGVDPFDNSIYYGSQFVHKSTDMGASWTIISPDLTTNDPLKQHFDSSGGLTYDASAAENHTTILTIAPSPVERGLIWVGTDDGNVQLTRDGGDSWENMVGNIRGVPEATWVPHIEPSKFNGGTAFVVFDDHRRSNQSPYIYKTTDYGRSWESLVTEEIEGFIHVVEQDPVNPNLLYLGTEFGMYISFNGGESWHLWTHGVPRAPVRALIVHPRDHDLVIGTHGRAAYIVDDVRPLRALADDPTLAGSAIHLFDIPPAILYQTKQVDGMRFVGDTKFAGENKAEGARLSFFVNTEEDSVRVAFEVTQGTEVVRRFRVWAKPGMNRTQWNLFADGFPRSGATEEQREFPPSGWWVLEGTYTVTARMDSIESSATVEVTFDPRYDIPIEEQRRKLEVLEEVSGLQAVAQEAMHRSNEAKESIDALLEVLDSDDSTHTPIRELGDSIKTEIDEVREEFSGPQDVQGFMNTPNTVFSKLGEAFGLTSYWGAPTPSQMTYLRHGEARLQEALVLVNDVLDAYADLRRQAEDMDLDVMKEVESLSIDWRPER